MTHNKVKTDEDPQNIEVEDWLDKVENENNENMVAIGKRKLEYEDIEVPIYHYIGESSRSIYERGGEHLKDLEYRRTKSHMLRHCVEIHPNILPETVEFRMRILSSHKTAFERQLREAVMIDYFAGPYLLYSRIEYNRCAIPKIELRLGNKELKEDPSVTKEKGTVEKIKLLFKGENKRQVEVDIEGEGSLEDATNDEKKKRRMDYQNVLQVDVSQVSELDPGINLSLIHI